MIIKGGPRGRGSELAAHLMRADTNEKVSVFDTRSVFSGTVRGALGEMEAVAAGSKATKPLYHVSINPEANERLTQEQWLTAADRLEKALGMEGHQRVMVEHVKYGKDGVLREHMHICWGRVDPETMKAAHHSHNYRTHEEVARDLEREFGLNRTQGIHAEREGEKKPRDRPKSKESQQEARTGWRKADAQADIADAWRDSKTGGEFQSHIEAKGYHLARGDKRDFVVVDPTGGPHAVRSGVKGLRAADIRDRFADLDPANLPSVAEAKAAARATYPAFLQQQQERNAQSAILPLPSVRPTTPQPGRYDVLQPSALLKTATLSQPNMEKPPQPVPRPPSWTREAEAKAPQQPSSPTPTTNAPSATHTPDSAQPESAAVAALTGRRNAYWAQTMAGLVNRHDKAAAQLDAHHERRMAGLTTDIDQRLKELNGLASRAGALVNRAERDREIAYLVAQRQRSLADEKARQDAAKDDLRRSQIREISDAKGQHDRLTGLLQKGLENKEARQQEVKPQPQQARQLPKAGPQDYDR